MKKIILAVILAAVAVFAFSCDDANENKAEETNGTTEATSAAVTDETETKSGQTDTSKAYVCQLESGVSITLGGELPELGEPLSYAEATSCIHPGMDKVYTYDGFTVTTSPDANGNNLVSEVSITSDAAVLKGGITIGADKDTVISVLGEGYTEQFGVMTYNIGDAVISVVLGSDSKVTAFAASVSF